MIKKVIKSCPFCGDIAECTTSIETNEYLKYKVECSSCFCRTDLYDHPEIAIEKWNLRLRKLDE